MKTIDKGHYGFAEGMIIGPSMPKYEGGMRQIDWAKVREFIETNKDNLLSVEAGLAEDWSYTGGEVWNSGIGYIDQDDTYVYGASSWATPSISVEFKNGNSETYECWMLGNIADAYFEN